MLAHVLGSFAEFERAILKERTKLGLARARAEGRIGGNRAKLTLFQQTEARKILAAGDRTQSEVAEMFQVHRSTISRLTSETRVFGKLAATGLCDQLS
jgi:DNA invertase Pin-like site-specific DNA recombinase